MLRITILLLVIFRVEVCQNSSEHGQYSIDKNLRENFQESHNIKLLTLIYNTNLNSSVRLEKEDRELRDSWAVDTQVKRINVTTKYRMQMTRHRKHSFQRPDLNEKWSECLYLNKRQIRKASKDYYADESECVTTSTLEDRNSTKSVEQVEKEIRKWRKGYRYLLNTCKADNPDDAEASDTCLVQYMERDNYNQVIQRLIVLKLETMGNLYLQLSSSLTDLEECLRAQLSTFLEKVRQIMNTLNKCYSLKLNENAKI